MCLTMETNNPKKRKKRETEYSGYGKVITSRTKDWTGFSKSKSNSGGEGCESIG